MTPTVYVIDDDDFVRSWAIEVAGALGYRALGYASAEAFLDSPRQDRPACMVLDLKLGGMSGIDLLHQLVSLGRSIPAVAYSGKADVTSAVSLMESGAMTLIEKPCSVETLAAAINSALEQDQRRLAVESTLATLHDSNESLSERERVVLERLLAGKLNKAIARELDVSERTIEGDRARLYKKFEVNSVAELAVKSTQLQLLIEQQQSPASPTLTSLPQPNLGTNGVGQQDGLIG
ncbi:Response regulator protein TmoT [Pseudobythopirellula maris]|uniref:Response regulator protein TmoT n=1 Tax=Pseudobythopirellula maris TaxID=2527991 RepID=A0A5C5ZQY7_9BACT|nr:response regulator [Pseudobythopirellula maris]TWT89899.1 Response regulator protein TmoT [Pseudobythopirellula maris]